MRERERHMLALFHDAARRVPAYKDFLRKNRVKPAKVRTLKDFELVPPVDKNNYLRAYPFEKLLWDGSAARHQVLTATSGSTGLPFYFPRPQNVDEQSMVFHKLFLDYTGAHRKGSTLVVICFGMGAWVGGLITYQAFRHIAENTGYPLSLFTPGPSKKEVFEALRRLGPQFDRVILCGYPPLIKDIIDEGPKNGVRWRSFDLRIIFAAEAFSEDFRNYILKKTGIRDRYRGTMNIYGSADLGTMAEETPLSILVRRTALQQPKLYEQLVHHAHRLPTLAQFIPGFVDFESNAGEVLCTGDSAMPLIRYAIGDHGGLLSFDAVDKMAKNVGIDLTAEARRAGIERTVAQLPFVYVYERSDLSTKLYGAIIYPEHVRHGTYHPKVSRYLTGKFTMFTKADNWHNQFLEINVELRPGVKVTEKLERLVRELINRELFKHNAEHRNNVTLMPGRVDPKVVFWRHEHPAHFKPGAKQKWVKR